ncbi:MAG: endolytic transglycosylase MltG [Gammaproteobacteria bacterium]|nr:endolytic transglycosylase MltG [Gammaproteobacteria bacterium]
MMQRLLGVLIIVTSLATGWFMMEFDNFRGQALKLSGEGITYQLEPGTGVATLALDLQQRGILDKPLLLRILARWNEQAHLIKAGEYWIPAGTTPEELLALLVSGKVTTHALTLVEGWTFRQMMAAVNASDALTHLLEGLSDEAIMQRLGHAGEHPEGRFLSDTYHFPRGMTDLQFLQRAYDAMTRKLAQKWEQREEGLPLMTPYEAQILASIVEKETGLASERPTIAGVFIRRLRLGMKLQTDPTIIYGLGDAYDGNIRRSDLKKDTPYNTYLHKGLTPTPICMPGEAALDAVLHPAESKSLYFVAKGDGSHYFSSTLKEHNRAVRKYQLKK